ncbi:Tethering factor for nuclear proteasome sts1 [Ancistrocladus abbreviatus]
MAPPNDPVVPLLSVLTAKSLEKCFHLSDGKLSVRGVPLLSEVPSNVSFTNFSSICKSSDASPALFQRVQAVSYRGGFLGFEVEERSDRIVNSLGKFNGRNFISIFRFKTWWSTQWVGTSGSDLQMETQWIVLEVPEVGSYAIIVPIIEGSFRSALHPGNEGHVLICAESGSTHVTSSSFKAIAYVHVSENPYNLMKEAYSAIRVHLNTFKLLEEKSAPPLIDKFGWCTWDAFYLTVDPIGVWYGVNEFAKGGLSLRFLIIDDGWQSINLDSDDPHQDTKNMILGGEQMTARMHRLDEGQKFRNYKGGSILGPDSPSYNPMRPKLLIAKAVEVEQAVKQRKAAAESGVTDLSDFDARIQKLKQELDELVGEGQDAVAAQSCRSCSCSGDSYGMKAFTKDLRTQFKGLDDIYVWHALCGAWGGVKPGATHLKSTITPCRLSPGLKGTMDDLAVDKIIEGRIGLVDPEQAGELYDSMHSYLASTGITGVKVDVIHTLEYVSEEHGGRVQLAKSYYDGMSESLKKNLNGTNLISSMQQCNDFFFLGTKQISMGRVGDDFWFQDPNGDPNGVFWLQGVHMIHCSYNSLWMGQIIHPDWDMFQSDHVCAKFHAGSRAICGGPVYVSDSLGGHDFDLLKKLVYPDGTIPKCLHYALPTRDCLFKNPLFDQKTILKIWNFNKYGGVVGAFNCQGAGWDKKERRIKGYKECYRAMEGSVHVSDIEWDQREEGIEMGCAEEYAVYLNQADSVLFTTLKSEPIHIVIQPSSFEIFSFVPVMKLARTVRFAAIGLTNMFNSGGTIQESKYKDCGADTSATMKIKGGGTFLAYSSEPPKKCFVNGAEVGYEWVNQSKLMVSIPWIEEAGGVSEVFIQY